MKIKEITQVTENINEFLDTTQVDPNISEQDTAAILSVKESDWSQPMTGDQLIEHMKKMVGNA